MDGMFWRLVWKDIQLVRTLVYVVAFAIVVCNVSIVLAYQANTWAHDGGGFLWLAWMAIPFLSAIGLPALLVGGEQENGTLAWLRTLPIPRARIIRAKLWVATAALFLIWALSTAAVVVAMWSLPWMGLNAWSSNATPELLCNVIYYSGSLLLCGFIAGYVLRSPFAAMFVSLLLSLLAPLWIGFQSEVLPQSERRLWGTPVTTLLAGVGYLTLLAWLHHVIALSRLRLGNPSHQGDSQRYSVLDAVGISLDRDSSASATHVNVRLSVPKWKRRRDRSIENSNSWSKHATPMNAMLWQAYSQQFWPVLGLMIIALPFLVIYLLEPVTLLMCWLGSMTFYGDTVRKRYLYFAARPIDRTGIWLTRVALPLAAIAAITLFLCVPALVGADPWPRIALGYFGFGIGALVSMAASRPILGFLGGPVLFLIAVLLQRIYLVDYWAYVSWSGIASLPVLFATWRLIPQWRRGIRGIGFDARVVAYVLLGMLSLAVAVFGYRIASVPAEQTAWRMAMINEAPAVRTVNSNDPELDLDAYLTQRQEIILARSDAHPRDHASLRQQLLQLCSKARQAILAGELDSTCLFNRIEQDELTVLLEIWGMPSMQVRETLQDFPEASLRKTSREFALKDHWRRYQDQSWRDEQKPGSTYFPKHFAGFTVGQELMAYPWERTRADRLVDLAVKETLEAIKRDTLHEEQTMQRIDQLWEQVRNNGLPSSRAASNTSPLALYTDHLLANELQVLDSPSQRATEWEQP